MCGGSLAVLGQTGHSETFTAAKCPSTESFGSFCVRRVCGLGNEPGEAVEHRLKQRWINHFSLWAGEWQLAWGHKHGDYWFWVAFHQISLNCSSQGSRTQSNIYNCIYTQWRWTLFLYSLCLSLSMSHTRSLRLVVRTLAVCESLLARMALWLCFLTGLQDINSMEGGLCGTWRKLLAIKCHILSSLQLVKKCSLKKFKLVVSYKNKKSGRAVNDLINVTSINDKSQNVHSTENCNFQLKLILLSVFLKLSCEFPFQSFLVMILSMFLNIQTREW